MSLLRLSATVIDVIINESKAKSDLNKVYISNYKKQIIKSFKRKVICLTGRKF